jgi:vacuolar-type H+-ATPase subunit E/Vma4
VSVEGLVEAIVADAEAEASAMLERAGQEAREIVEAARRHALERVVTARTAAAQAAQAEAAATLNALRLRVVGTHAATLSDWLERVFAAAVNEATAIGDGGDPGRWERALRRLVDEAAALAGPRARCAVRPVDAAAVRAVVDAAGVPLEVAVEPGLPPGLLARSADGRVEVDATLPVRASRAREQLAGHVALLLGADDLPRAVTR